MIEFLHQYETTVRSEGKAYAARAYAAKQAEGPCWEGWLVFFPLAGGAALSTDTETTQSTLDQVAYWARGVTPTYLEGALARALVHPREARLERRIRLAESEEAVRREEARVYTEAARGALAAAQAAELALREAEAELRARRGHARGA